MPRRPERYGAGRILICDYDPVWPDRFAEERLRLRTRLGDHVTAIEHIGSTSVPGLAAKPIIDILVGVRDLEEARGTCVAPLLALGYIYLPEYEEWLPGELFFRKGPPGPWTHHVHLTEPGSARWKEGIVFRDHLRAHPEVAAAYGTLKLQLAAEVGDDIVAFGKGKARFVAGVLAHARSGT